ncbi:MAG: TrmH family RNA methyltransferase [Planctomycetota bacterium]
MPAEPREDLAAWLRELATRGARDRAGLAVVEGIAPFLQACAAGERLEAIAWSEVLLRSSTAQKLVRLQRRAGVPTRHLRPEAFRALSRAVRASGVAAVVRQRWRPLEAVDPRAGSYADAPLWLALERVRSDGNLGTLLRTAEAVGAAGLICVGEAVDPYSLAAIRSSMGALFHLTRVRASHEALAGWLRRHGALAIAATPHGERLYCEQPLRAPVVLFLGEERRGLTPEAFACCEARVRLPVLGRGDSLNVAIAGGVLLYDLLRRLG